MPLCHCFPQGPYRWGHLATDVYTLRNSSTGSCTWPWPPDLTPWSPRTVSNQRDGRARPGWLAPVCLSRVRGRADLAACAESDSAPTVPQAPFPETRCYLFEFLKGQQVGYWILGMGLLAGIHLNYHKRRLSLYILSSITWGSVLVNHQNWTELNQNQNWTSVVIYVPDYFTQPAKVPNSVSDSSVPKCNYTGSSTIGSSTGSITQ